MFRRTRTEVPAEVPNTPARPPAGEGVAGTTTTQVDAADEFQTPTSHEGMIRNECSRAVLNFANFEVWRRAVGGISNGHLEN